MKLDKEVKKLLYEFIDEYDYGPCLMYQVINKDLVVLFKHWTFIRWQSSPIIFLGKISSIKNLKPTYIWLD